MENLWVSFKLVGVLLDEKMYNHTWKEATYPVKRLRLEESGRSRKNQEESGQGGTPILFLSSFFSPHPWRESLFTGKYLNGEFVKWKTAVSQEDFVMKC